MSCCSGQRASQRAAASPKNAENAVCGWQRAFAPCEKVV
ncbi:hypothetical protein MGSAQ_002353 [marine sediment metagenome]|uniref:Uncharacterized protein n=1 Tax=marine sediment metagenome TaxID=412755 RepID=A0A1B6NT98_9ZZZZ